MARALVCALVPGVLPGVLPFGSVLLVRIALPSSLAACCSPVPLPGTTPGAASCCTSWVRNCWLSWLASSSFGCRFTWPVTAAPAWRSADVTPVTTGPGAPGALTSTTRWPLSRPSSSRGSASLRDRLVRAHLLVQLDVPGVRRVVLVLYLL